jgi:hypothetical protein
VSGFQEPEKDTSAQRACLVFWKCRDGFPGDAGDRGADLPRQFGDQGEGLGQIRGVTFEMQVTE